MERYTLQKAANLVMNVRFTGCCTSLTMLMWSIAMPSHPALLPTVLHEVQVDGCIGALFLDLLYSSSMFSQVVTMEGLLEYPAAVACVLCKLKACIASCASTPVYCRSECP